MNPDERDGQNRESAGDAASFPDCMAPLFVPGDRPERFAKAASSGADAIILDLEDAVAPAAKADARRALRTGFTDLPVIVRLNAVGTCWHDDDLAAILALPVAGIMLPKADRRSVQEVTRAFAGAVPIIALVETAAGLSDARDLAAMAGVVRLAFGSVDYAADIGAEHARDALLGARLELVLASRLAALPAPLDGVTLSFGDDRDLEEDLLHARMLGFGGKMCIHPRQILATQIGFTPSAGDVDWARRVLACGDGVSTIDGMMIDPPVKARAGAIMRRFARSASRPSTLSGAHLSPPAHL